MTGRRFIPRTPGVELDATTRTLIAHAARLSEGWDEYDEYQEVLIDLAARILCWPPPMRREAIAQFVEEEIGSDRPDGWIVAGWTGPYRGCHCGCERPRELVCMFGRPDATAGAYMPTELDELLVDEP